MPILSTYSSHELDWICDFKPRKVWPKVLPVIAVNDGSIKVVAGFERRVFETISVLIVEGDLETVMRALHMAGDLRPLEVLRFENALGHAPNTLRFLLTLPPELQSFLDEKQVPLKALRPLEYLEPWFNHITEKLVKLQPSSSQVRELLDLLCDLKMQNRTWAECEPRSDLPSDWCVELFKLRNPNLTRSDLNSAQFLESVSWPKNVRAKWERQGDQGSINIQARISNPKEFQNFKTSIQKVEVKDELWNR